MSPTFHSLGVRNYRVYAAGALVSNVGTWMGRVAQDWLVLTVLTDHSAVALGTVTGLQFLPFLLLAPWAGMIADRFPKRRILFTTQSALLLTALALAVLTATGVVELWHVYVLATLQGVATALDNPARQTFVSEMVDNEHLPNAVALNSASFNLGRLIGPGVAGLLIAALGIAPAPADPPHVARGTRAREPRGGAVNFRFRHRITVAALALFILIAVVAAVVNR